MAQAAHAEIRSPGHVPGRNVPADVPPDVPPSRDPARQRAEDVAAAIAELRGDRAAMFGVVAARTAAGAPVVRRNLPTVWTYPFVHERLREAMATLDRMPAATRPREFGNAMPQWTYDRGDLVGWVDSGELERGYRARNRVRAAATPDQIERMGEAIQWPVKYLADKPEVSRAVWLAALWSARGLSFEKMTAQEGVQPAVHHKRWIFGLRLLAGFLNRDRVPIA